MVKQQRQGQDQLQGHEQQTEAVSFHFVNTCETFTCLKYRLVAYL